MSANSRRTYFSALYRNRKVTTCVLTLAFVGAGVVLADSIHNHPNAEVDFLSAQHSAPSKAIAAGLPRESLVVYAGQPAAAPLPIDDDVVDWNPNNRNSLDDPVNDRGNSPNDPEGNNNFQIVAPVLSLPGRGIDLNLNLIYNSLVWNKSGNEMAYDIDQDWPAPGWQLGFGKMVAMGNAGALIIESDGTRHSFTGTVFTDQYVWNGITVNMPTFKGETTDGSFIQYRLEGVNGAGQPYGAARYPNGTVVYYSNYSTDFSTPHNYLYPYSIIDANGNHISIKYLWDLREPRIERIIDSVGRVITFQYNSQKQLTAITAPGLPDAGGTPTTQTFVRLHYATLPLNLSGAFNGLTTRVRNSSPAVIDAIYYPATGTGYWFGPGSCSSYGMLTKVVEQRGMGFVPGATFADQGTITEGPLTKQQVYDYPSSPSALTAAPTFGNVTESWDGSVTAATTSFSVQHNSGVNERTSTITGPDGVKVVKKSFNLSSLPSGDPNKFKDGLVKEEQTLDSGNNLLRKTVFTWEAGVNNSPRLTRTETTDERGHVLATDYDQYGPNNAIGRVRDRDYSGAVVRTTRNTFVSYLDTDLDQRITPGAPSSVNPRPRRVNLIDSVKVYSGDDSASVLVSSKIFRYDEFAEPLKAYTPDYLNGYDLFAFGEPRQPNGITGILHHSGNFNPLPPNQQNGGGSGASYITLRGNLTSVVSYADTTNPSSPANPVTETLTYDMAGNVIASSRACCEQASSNFEVAMQYAFPTLQTRGSADPNSLMRVTTSSTYDLKTGLPLSSTDANGRQTTTTYFPGSLRPKQVLLPTGARTEYEYDDAAMKVTQTTRTSGGAIANQAITFLNGLGQVSQQQTLSGSVLDIVETEYDLMGRVSRQSRPYRNGDPLQWTTTTYDALGRVTRVAGPDGSTIETYYNERDFDPNDNYTPTRPNIVSASAPGETTLVRDPWGRERWGRSDFQGRLIEVVEPNPSGNDSVAVGGWATTYTYDTLGNLAGSIQDVQTRSFKHDALGRLTAQKLVETTATLNSAGNYVGSGAVGAQWSEFFVYDERSNLISRTDARGVKTLYSYLVGGVADPLNRVQSISWDLSGPHEDLPESPILPAATVSYQYRQKTLGSQLLDITQLTSVTTAGVSTESFVYDSEGRLDTRTLTLTSRASHPMVTSYVYDTLSRVTVLQYPAEYGNGSQPRKQLQHQYDNASRLSGLMLNGQNHASQIVHAADGQISSMNVGAAGPNQMVESYQYEVETGLLIGQKVARSSAPLAHILSLSYDYTGANGKRTGQVTKAINNLNNNKDRNYTYDALGRLTRTTGGPETAPLWTQAYSYDRFGNRTSVIASGSSAALHDGSSSPQLASASHAPGMTNPPVSKAVLLQEEQLVRNVSVEAPKELPKGPVESPKKESRSHHSHAGKRATQPLTPLQGGSTNVALASNGGTVSSSSTLSPYLESYVIDGFRRAVDYRLWMDSTNGNFTNDELTISFNGSKTIHEINVVTQQDTHANPVEPTLAQTFNLYGITQFELQYYNGTNWLPIPNGMVTGNNKVWRQLTFTPVTATKIKLKVTGGMDNAFSRVVEVEAWGSAAPPPPAATNVALASNGGTVSSSSTLSPYLESYVIDGSRRAVNYHLWMDGTNGNFTNDELTISFNGSKAIHEIDVVTQQDTHQNPVEPTLAQGFSLYGITQFELQYYNGTNWLPIPNGTVTGNNKVWRQLTFTPVTATKIKLKVTGGMDNAFSRVVEVEAWGSAAPPPPAATNVALASNGGTVSSSSTLSPYLESYVIDGSRRAVNYHLWMDGTNGNFTNDELTISFNGSKTIHEIDVVTQQDTHQNPVEPTLAQTFNLYGITQFELQYYNGTNWLPIPNGTVTGNNKVWRQLTFTPVTATKIKLKVTGGMDNAFSRVVEVEAWGSAASGGSGGPPIPLDGISSLSVNTASNRITTAGFAYDAAGNQIRALAPGSGSQRFHYDAANRLVKVKTDDNQTVMASYTYGASNARLIAEEGGMRTYYVCDGRVEYTESGSSTNPIWSKTYVYFGARLLSTLTPSGSGGEFIQYHHPDRLGTRLVTNAQDTTYFEQVNLPFGTALTAESTGTTNRRFTSYDRSANTGLDYAINRHYDARQGRFTQVDPIGMKAASLADPQSLNMYSYVGNDPVNRVDPDGQFWGALFRFITGFFRSLRPNIINGSFAYRNQPPISVSFTTNFQNIGVAYAGIGIPLRSGGFWITQLLSQNPGFNVPSIAKAVRDMLATPDCANFVRSILDAVASNKNPVYPENGSLSDVFEAFLTQGRGAIFSTTLPPGSAGFANPSGNIRRRTGMIHINSQALHHPQGTISEIFHLAGRNRLYTDKDLAIALSRTPYALLAYTRVGPDGPMWIAPEMNIFDPRYRGKPYWTEKNQLAYSAYFHTIQSNVCNFDSSFSTVK